LKYVFGCHRILKKTIMYILYFGIPEKNGLLLVVAAKMLQKSMLFRRIS
jgi:hypothetical protein